MNRKEILAEIKRLMTEFQKQANNPHKNPQHKWFLEGKVEGLNIVWKMLNGLYIKEEYE